MANSRNALIVATSKYYDARLPPLEAPRQDATALKRVLGNEEIGGFSVQVALNSRVQTLRKTLEGFFAHRDRDDLLLLHFSCHGLKDDEGQLYLAAADTEIDLLRATALDADWLRHLMNDCRSEKIALFLDCCFAGAFAAGVVHKVGVDTPGIKDHLEGTGTVVITASNAIQYAFEGGNRLGTPEASAFTRALVDGLHTGEADQNGDGEVTINELFEYLADKVREVSPSQTPKKWVFDAAGDWVIARSNRAPRASVELLPVDLQNLLTSPDIVHKLAALVELQPLLEAADPMLADSAELAVQQLASDDSLKVSTAAKRLLEERDARHEEAERLAREKDEAERLAADERIAADKAAADKAAADKAAADQLARDKAAADQREADRIARAEALATQAEADRIGKKAEADRLAREKDDAERQAAIAAEKAEAERQAAIKAKRIAQARRARRIRIGAGITAVGVVAVAAFAGMGCLGRECPVVPSSRPTGAVPPSGVVPPNSVVPGSGVAPGTSVAPLTGTIVFSADTDLWVAAPDGSGMKRLVGGSGNQTDAFWSPDGSQVVYKDPAGLRIVTKAGVPVPGINEFTHHVEDINPAWSPNGKAIAFASDRSYHNREIYTRLFSALDVPPKRLTVNTVADWDPSWSPKSDRIAFARGRGGIQAAIWTVDATGKNEKQLTTDSGVYDDPAWSPDGNWIAATRRKTQKDRKVVWLMRSDGSDPRALTNSGVNEHDPTWSPDGLYLAFSRGDSTRQIVVVDLDGHELFKFGRKGASNSFAEWR
jgi:hypothetical protein